MQLKIEEKTKKMMKKIVLIFLIIMAMGIGLFYLPIVRDEIRYQIADLRGTDRAYEIYLEHDIYLFGTESKKSNMTILYNNSILFYIVNPSDFINNFKRAWAIKRYEEYLNSKSKNVIHNYSQAKPRISERLFWWWMKFENTPEAYEEYIYTYRSGTYEIYAWTKLFNTLWNRAKQENSILSYTRYVYNFEKYDAEVPNFEHGITYNHKDVQKYTIVKQKANIHFKEAKKNISLLKTDDRPFDKAARKATTQAWINFLENFPGHYRYIEAFKNLADSKPASIFYLQSKKLLEITPFIDANGIASIAIHNKCKRNLNFFIPVGTYFKSVNPRVMDMLVFSNLERELPSYASFSKNTIINIFSLNQDKKCIIHLLTHGTSITKRKPVKGDKFTLSSLPSNQDLVRLMAYAEFDKKSTLEWECKEAIWLINENVNLKDFMKYYFKVFEEDYNYSGKMNLEYAEQSIYTIVIMAMQMINDAGLDIKSYRIWNDREEIFWSLKNLGCVGPSCQLDEMWRDLLSFSSDMSKKISVLDDEISQNIYSYHSQVSIKAPEKTRSIGWLSRYLRNTNINVNYEKGQVSSNTIISFKDKRIRKVGKIISKIVQKTLNLKVLKETENSLILQGGSLQIIVNPQPAKSNDLN